MYVTQLPVLGALDEQNTMAFSKLEGNGVSYFMNSLEITLGKKYSNEKHTDLPLSFDARISKFHALLFYNFYSKRYELAVTGRSGARVQNKLVAVGTTVSLESGDTIQIGDTIFKFILPKAAETREYIETVDKTYEESVSNQSIDYALEYDDDYAPQDIDNSINSNSSEDEFFDADQENEPQVDTAKFATVRIESEPYTNALHLCKHKPDKPFFPIWILIACAIKESSKGAMTKGEIFKYLRENYPYFKSKDQATLKSTIQYVLNTNSMVRCVYDNTWSINAENECKVEEEINKVLEKQAAKTQANEENSHDIISSYKYKEGEPPFPLHVLIAHAIHLSNKDGLLIREIVTFLETHFPYYKTIHIDRLRRDVYKHLQKYSYSTVTPGSRYYRWKTDPEKNYNIHEFVKKALQIEEEFKRYCQAVGCRKIKYDMDPDQLVAKWMYKEEIPPFSLAILAAYAINEADENLVHMKYITDYISEHFLFYKPLGYEAIQRKVRGSIIQSSSVVIVLRTHRSDCLYALDPDTSNELRIQKHIRQCIEIPYFDSRNNGPRRPQTEDTITRSKKIKIEEDDDFFKAALGVNGINNE